MYPVGFYDLRDASKSSVPVVSTAFRPVEAAELAKNPFRVFTSMLVATDRRFFDAETQARLEEFVGARTLFGPELLELADRSADQRGLDGADAGRFLDLADRGVRAVHRAGRPRLVLRAGADLGRRRRHRRGAVDPHQPPDAACARHRRPLPADGGARGITMIDEIQGPPDWEGPDVLLRQTSFKALAEQRRFRHADGSVRPGSLRVRFGEVEQRGVALTARGRDLYDRMVAEIDVRLAAAPAGTTRVDVAREVVAGESCRRTERELAVRGSGVLHPTELPPRSASTGSGAPLPA